MTEDEAARELFELLRRRGGGTAAVTPATVKDLALVVARFVTTPLIIADNRVDRCRECDARVQCRPFVPTRALVCAPCALRMVRGDA